jgi:DUF177 domain-containing protein
MFISIQELKLHRVDYDSSFSPGKIDFGPDIRQLEDLKTRGTAELLEEHRGGKNILEDIRLVASYTTKLELSCDRCLEPVEQSLMGDFDLIYRPLGSDAGKSDISICAADTEIGYYQGDGMLLEEVLKEQVLLALPVKVVCGEECKGLCPHCGKNLNHESCNCGNEVTDSRWAALTGLRDKLKQ